MMGPAQKASFINVTVKITLDDLVVRFIHKSDSQDHSQKCCSGPLPDLLVRIRLDTGSCIQHRLDQTAVNALCLRLMQCFEPGSLTERCEPGQFSGDQYWLKQLLEVAK